MDLEQEEQQVHEQVSLALFADDKESAIGIYDDVIARFLLRFETGIVSSVAKAMYYKLITLVSLCRDNEALACVEVLVSRFADRQDVNVGFFVAKSLLIRANILWKEHLVAEEIAAYDELISRFGDRDESCFDEPYANRSSLLFHTPCVGECRGWKRCRHDPPCRNNAGIRTASNRRRRQRTP